MKIIEPKVEEIKDFIGVDNFYHAVARAARICYASENNNNDKELCDRLLKSKHCSPFSHAILHLKSTYMETTADNEFIDKIFTLIYSNKFTLQYYGSEIIVNGRIIAEAVNSIEELDEVLDFIKTNNFEFISDVHPYHFRSFIVDTSIGCTREINRHHDNFYICEQSTRYCNFSKDKFGNEVAFNKPYWYDTKNSVYKAFWTTAMENAEMFYLTAIKDIPNDLRNCSDDEFGMGFPIDEARGILPLDTHTRAIYTATIEEWKHFIDMRLHGTTGTPHGDIKVIAEKINDLIFNKNIRTA